MDPDRHFDLTIGSLEGEGTVTLGGHALIIGSNNLSTTFSGLIEDGLLAGALVKIGTGTLTLSGANTYTGGTTVTGGTLLVQAPTGSATGSGPVQVNAGTFGGTGSVSGAVTVGTGTGPRAFLAPGVKGPGTLLITNALTFKSNGSYNCELGLTPHPKTDEVGANGVTIESGAQFNFQAVANKRLTAGTLFTVISNTSANPIAGTFANLADGSTFTVGRNNYQVSYSGGDGNDLSLTVVP